jgi:hypothetical protein
MLVSNCGAGHRLRRATQLRLMPREFASDYAAPVGCKAQLRGQQKNEAPDLSDEQHLTGVTVKSHFEILEDRHVLGGVKGDRHKLRIVLDRPSHHHWSLGFGVPPSCVATDSTDLPSLEPIEKGRGRRTWHGAEGGAAYGHSERNTVKQRLSG